MSESPATANAAAAVAADAVQEREFAAPSVAATAGPPIPRNFIEYLKSFGPGIVIALTWLGASDLVNSSIAGADYGYALMWALVVSLLARFAFVNIIAKYELCNERGETLMAGLLRLHRGVPMLILALTFIMAHLYGSYLLRGLGEATYKLAFGLGAPWMWTLGWVAATLGLVFTGGFAAIEKVFYVFLGLMSAAFIGIAAWVGPSPTGILKGVFLFQVPASGGTFTPVVVVVALIGAMAGSIPNLLYPYFIRQKGWNGPRYRRVQTYDLLFGVLILIVLDLSVWVVAAEVLHPRGVRIHTLEDLSNLFVMVVGPLGAPLFNAGVLATTATTVIGCAMGFGYLSQDIALKLRRGPDATMPASDMKNARMYRAMVLWFLFSPLVWSIPSMPGFIPLTVAVSVASVFTVPLLAGILWYITASPRYIGAKQKNNIWENLTMAVLFLLASYATWQTFHSLL